MANELKKKVVDGKISFNDANSELEKSNSNYYLVNKGKISGEKYQIAVVYIPT